VFGISDNGFMLDKQSGEGDVKEVVDVNKLAEDSVRKIMDQSIGRRIERERQPKRRKAGPRIDSLLDDFTLKGDGTMAQHCASVFWSESVFESVSSFVASAVSPVV